MKEYIFENVLNSNITIEIKAENALEAGKLLIQEIKDSSNYKFKLTHPL